jgi:hypothetical protein
MNFDLSHEHQMHQYLVASFVRDQLLPLEASVMGRETAGQGS